MSTTPRDPFQNDFQPGQGYAQSPPPAKSSAKFWLIGCGALLLLGMLTCCGGILFVTQFGMGMLAEEFQSELDGNPVIVEHIGEIESMGMSWSETINQAQKDDASGDEIAFEIEGTKGSGVVLIEQDNAGDGTGMRSAVLVLPDGSRYPLELEQTNEPNVDLDPSDIDTGETTEEAGVEAGVEAEITEPADEQ